MSTQVTTSLNLRRQVSQADRVRAHRRGRVCAHEGCETILSIYNSAKFCAVHTKVQGGRRPGQPLAVREVACEQCGLTFETANPHRRYCSDRCRMAAFARRKRSALRDARRAAKAAPASPAAETEDRELVAGVA